MKKWMCPSCDAVIGHVKDGELHVSQAGFRTDGGKVVVQCTCGYLKTWYPRYRQPDPSYKIERIVKRLRSLSHMIREILDEVEVKEEGDGGTVHE